RRTRMLLLVRTVLHVPHHSPSTAARFSSSQPSSSHVTLDCNVLSSGHQSMEWMLPDLTTLEKTDSHRIVSEHNRLVIKNTSLSDSGLYHCFVRTETDVDIISYRLTVRERLLSPSDLNGKKMSVDYGESLILPCSVTSPQPVETRWILPKHEILNASDAKGRIHVSQNNTLIIKNVLDEDTGEYSCLAANLHGVDMLSHMVVVASKKEEDSSVSSVVEGESHFLHSEDTEGEPEPLLKWLFKITKRAKM
uniref:Ig-like domain-containing protein n=1 Tax=Electrophorus electricus TaxID=8005 RepID=A0AAY5EWJ0_ELEEL